MNNTSKQKSPMNYNNQQDDYEDDDYEQDQQQQDYQQDDDDQNPQVSPYQDGGQAHGKQVNNNNNNNNYSDDEDNFYSNRDANSHVGTQDLRHDMSKKSINNTNHINSNTMNIQNHKQNVVNSNHPNHTVMNTTATFEQNQQKNQLRQSIEQNQSNNKAKNTKNQPIKAKPLQSQQQFQMTADPVSIEQMSDINHKLKEELSQLIDRLEIALNKFKDRKEKDKLRYGINPLQKDPSGMPDDYLQKERELKNAHNRAFNVKKEIQKIRRKLETSIDINAITELENEIKNKEQLLARLEDQNTQIKKVGSQQQAAMRDLNKEEELQQQQLSTINMQIRQVKLDTRQIQEQYKELDKSVQEEHKIIYDLEERYRKINMLIQQRKRQKNANNSNGAQDQPVDPDDQLTEEELEQQIKALEDIKQEKEQKGRRQIAELDKLITTQREEQEINEIKLRDKDQQLKNAELKIKELKRQIQVIQLSNKAASNITAATSDNNNNNNNGSGADGKGQDNNNIGNSGGAGKQLQRRIVGQAKKQLQQ